MNQLRNERIIKVVCQFIEARLGDSLTITELAKNSGYSKEQLIRIFKEVTGVPPSVYVRSQKVEQAKRWLVYSEMTITEISNGLGYMCPSSFSRMFQNVVGIPPMEFRNVFGKMT